MIVGTWYAIQLFVSWRWDVGIFSNGTCLLEFRLDSNKCQANVEYNSRPYKLHFIGDRVHALSHDQHLAAIHASNMTVAVKPSSAVSRW
jgi:hypothetical protein